MAHGSRALDDMAGAAKMADGLGNLGFWKQDHIVQQIAAQRKGDAVLQTDAAAKTVGKAGGFHDLDGMAGDKACSHRRAVFHRQADNARRGRQRLDGHRDAGRKPAARQGHQHSLGFHRGNLQPQRALARDDRLMVKGRDLGHALAGHGAGDLDHRLVLRRADDADLGPQIADRLHLVVRHQPRQADGRGHAKGPGGMRHRAAMIAGRSGNDTPRQRIGRQRQDGIGRAAQLEGTRRLAVFAFQPDRLPQPFRQRLVPDQRGFDHMPADAPGRGADIVQRHAHAALINWPGATAPVTPQARAAAQSVAELAETTGTPTASSIRSMIAQARTAVQAMNNA